MKTKSYGWMFKQTLKEFGEDRVLRLSAALAYYAIFSLGPLLVIGVGVAGLVFDSEAVRHQVEQQLQSLVGPGAAQMVDSMMSAQNRGTSVIATIIGVLVMLLGAGGVFGQLQDSLNTIWEVKAKPGKSLWKFLRRRFLSLTMVLGVGFLLLISMALTTFLSSMTDYFGTMYSFSESLAHGLNFVLSFSVITCLFALIFKFLPDVRVPWSKVWIGAIGTSVLFTAGKYLLGLYLGREETTSAFGAASAVVLVLMWVYYGSLILFFGAEFTQVYARASGAVIEPKSYAELVTEEERAEEGIPRKEAAHAAKPIGKPIIKPLPSFASTVEPPDFEVPARRPALGMLGIAVMAGLATGLFIKGRHLIAMVRRVRQRAHR